MSLAVLPRYRGYADDYAYGAGASGGDNGSFHHPRGHGSVQRQPIGHMMVSWTRPKPGCFKLNTDGASKGNPGPSFCGGIIRDSDGKWVFGFHMKIGIASSIEAELWALHHGLMLAVHKGLGREQLEVEVDATQVLMLIDGRYQPHNDLQRVLVSQCRVLLEQFGLKTPKHVYREGNECADIMANLHLFRRCATQDSWPDFTFAPSFSFWASNSAPSCIEERMLEDASGKLYERILY